MALVKTDGTIVSIRGRVGGVYFKSDKAGIHCQSMPRKARHIKTPVGRYMVSQWSLIGILWLALLVGSFLLLWILFAKTWQWISKRGPQNNLTGNNWYMIFGMKAAQLHQPPLWKPPNSPHSLPNYYVDYRGSWLYQHAPDDWPADCPAGYFYEAGTYNAHPYYRVDTNNWFLWFKGRGWFITPTLGVQPPGLTYVSPIGEILGKYTNPDTGLIANVYTGAIM